MQRSERRSHCWKHFQKSSTGMLSGPPTILVEPLERQQNASFSVPSSSVATKKKVARSEVGRVGGMGHNHHFVFYQKLLNAQGRVGGGVVMVQEPIPILPLFWTFSSHALMQSSQHIETKLLIYSLSLNRLRVHYPISIKKKKSVLS
jgi:hypothetical protein